MTDNLHAFLCNCVHGVAGSGGLSAKHWQTQLLWDPVSVFRFWSVTCGCSLGICCRDI